ncbi:hypothetical protein [Arthrobacter sp. MW3 TE3886]|uniref:hypothetical protein n=1 Tax=Arthrobacter sp. MW3 TE3886 TaxID=3156254 RepID=UPI0035148100
MIIQAGFDFQVLARPFIVQDGKLMPKLVVMCVDEEMRLDTVEVMAEDFAGSLTPFHDAVLAALHPEFTKYFAIAHPGRFSEYDFSEPIMDEADALESKAAERGVQLIGHFAIDETGYMSARAHSYFDQYPSHDDLPRTMFHWSHSRLGKCARA